MHGCVFAVRQCDENVLCDEKVSKKLLTWLKIFVSGEAI